MANWHKVVARELHARLRANCRLKVRYEDYESARTVASRVKNQCGHRFPPRVYACDICAGWHLTTKTPGL